MTQPRATRSLSLCTPRSISARLFRSLSPSACYHLLALLPPVSSSRYLVPFSRSSIAYNTVSLADPVLTFHARSVFLRIVRTSFFRYPPPTRPPCLPALFLLVCLARTSREKPSAMSLSLSSLSLSSFLSLSRDRLLSLSLSLTRALLLPPPVPRPTDSFIQSVLSHTLCHMSDRAFLS